MSDDAVGTGFARAIQDGAISAGGNASSSRGGHRRSAGCGGVGLVGLLIFAVFFLAHFSSCLRNLTIVTLGTGRLLRW